MPCEGRLRRRRIDCRRRRTDILDVGETTVEVGELTVGETTTYTIIHSWELFPPNVVTEVDGDEDTGNVSDDAPPVAVDNGSDDNLDPAIILYTEYFFFSVRSLIFLFQ